MDLAELSRYFDKQGLVHYQCDPAESGNGILYTSEYYLGLWSRGTLAETDARRFKASIDALTVSPGLYKRHPNYMQAANNAPDDYTGLAHAAWRLGLPFARDIVAHGRKTGWVFDTNQVPQMRDWFFRMPQLIAHFLWAANERVPFWRQVWWAVSTWAVAAFTGPDDIDPWALTWHRVQVMNWRGYVFTRWAAEYFMVRFNRRFPAGMGQLRAVDFKTMNHPVSHAFWFGTRALP